MGGISSTPSTTTNPNSTTMSSTKSSQSHDPNRDPQPSIQESSDLRFDTSTPHAPIDTNTPKTPIEDGEEEEDGECGFCLFMKGGGCKDRFIEWEKCVEEGEKNNEDVVERCFQATSSLTKCMQAHSDYYAPILKAEKAAKEEAVKELEKEKEKLDSNGEVVDGSQQEKKS